MNKKVPEGPLFFLAFLVIAAVYFYRMFTEGAVPVAGDGLEWIYPMWLYGSQSGPLPPLWTQHMFAGMPFVALMQTASLYPPNIILYAVLPAKYAFNAGILLHYALAGLFAFMYLREIGLRRMSAFSGGIVFAFSGFVISTVSHVAVLNASVWLPLIVLFAERLRKSLSARHALAMSLAVAAQIFAGNFQMCVYTYIVLGMYFAFSAFDVAKGNRLRFMGSGALGVMLGFLMAFPQIYATWQLSGMSLRPVVRETLGVLFTKEFHIYLKTLPSLVFPHLYSRSDFGVLLPVPGDRMVVFAGILPLSLAILAVVKGYGQSNRVKLWAAVGLLGLVLAAADDTSLGKLLIDIPVYGMFHANGRNMLEFSIALSVLFAVGMDKVLSEARLARDGIKALAGVAAAAAAALAVTYVAEGTEAAKALRLANPAIYVPVLLFVLYALSLGLFYARPKKAFTYVLFVFLLAEAYSFGGYHGSVWTSAEGIRTKCGERGYDYLKGAGGDEPFRAAVVENVWRNQFNVPCGLSTFNSYDQLIFADYAALFDMEPFGMSRYWDGFLAGNSLLSMMNVKYLMVSPSADIRLDNIETVTGGAGGKGMAWWPGPFSLPDPQDRKRNSATFGMHLPEGTYVVAMKASSPAQKSASLWMEVYGEGQVALMDTYLPFNPYPGVIGQDTEEYYRIYRSEKPDNVTLRFATLKGEEIKISDVGIIKLEVYGPPPIAASGKVYELMHMTEGYDIYRNNNALPRAYSVTGLIGASDIRELKKMFDFNEVNPATHAVLFDEDLKDIGAASFSKAEVSVEEYGREKVTIRTSSPGESFVVLADQYYPGWRAKVDGKRARIWKTNGILRGVVVPEGEHELVFEYSPLWFKVSMTGTLVIAAAALFIVLRKREEKEA